MPVGAIAIMSVQRTMNNGLWAGFTVGMGAAFGDLIYATIAGFGISMIKDFLLANRLWLAIGGGIFLIFIGFKIYSSDTVKQIRSKKNLSKKKMANDFLSSFLLSLSNPVTILGFTGFFASIGIISDQTTIYHISSLLVGVFIGATTWWFSISLIINKFKSKISLKNIVLINRVAGIAVVIFGIALIIAMFVFKKHL
jgi:threonine/homoserine/homoserine lactone efflux protein